jgi:hypothetical protein
MRTGRRDEAPLGPIDDATPTLVDDTTPTLVDDTTPTLVDDTTPTLVDDTTPTLVDDTPRLLVTPVARVAVAPHRPGSASLEGHRERGRHREETVAVVAVSGGFHRREGVRREAIEDGREVRSSRPERRFGGEFREVLSIAEHAHQDDLAVDE